LKLKRSVIYPTLFFIVIIVASQCSINHLDQSCLINGPSFHIYIYIYIYIYRQRERQRERHTHTLPRNKVILAYLSHLTRIIYVKFEVFLFIKYNSMVVLRSGPIQDLSFGFWPDYPDQFFFLNQNNIVLVKKKSQRVVTGFLTGSCLVNRVTLVFFFYFFFNPIRFQPRIKPGFKTMIYIYIYIYRVRIGRATRKLLWATNCHYTKLTPNGSLSFLSIFIPRI